MGGWLVGGVCGLACLVAPVCADPAGLDGSFGSGGVLPAGIGPGDEAAHAAVVQADDKILVAGYFWNGTDNDFMIARFLSHGPPDPAFSAARTPIGSGDDIGRAMAVQSDGKILVAGSTHNGTNYDFALVRYLADGTLDYGFGTDGKVTTAFGTGNDHARAVAIQNDGKIVVAGYARIGATDDIAVARYLDTGELDTGFSTDGKATFGTTLSHDYGLDMVVKSGKVIVGGYAKVISSNVQICAVVRLTSAGAADATFGTSGAVNTAIGGTDDRIHAIAVQSDGKIVAAGYAEGTFGRELAVLRYDTNGGLDETFGDEGIVTTGIGSAGAAANALTIQADQKIVVAGDAVGTNGDFAVARYLSNGTLDAGFCGAGKAVVPVGAGTDSCYGVALQSDGKVVLVGASHNGSDYDVGLARLFGTPVPEIEVEQPAGTVLTDGGAADFSSTAVAVGPRIERAFTIRNAGSADLTGIFASIDGANQGDFQIAQHPAFPVAPGATTTVIVSFLSSAEGARKASLHLTSNDANENPFDLSLTGTGRVPPTITTITPLPPGMVDTPYNLAFTVVGGTPPYTWEVISGSLPDGLSLSGPGMLVGTPTAAMSRSISIQVTGGDGLAATTNCSITILAHLRLGDGDPTFDTDGKLTTAVGAANDSGQAVAVQADGRILVAGYAQVGGIEDFAVVRYLANGTLDPSFGAGGVVTKPVGAFKDYGRCIALQSDGRILVAGEVSNGSAYDFGVVRFLANGTPDPSFGTGGIATVSIASGNDYPKGLFVRGDGKIVVAGAANTDFGVARLNADGSLDTTFGTGGKVVTDFGTSTFDYAEAALMQSDGRIIVAGRVSTATHGYDFGLVRYQEDGALDATFGTGGKVSTPVGGGTMEDICFGLAEQSDGRILAAGDSLSSSESIVVVRYLANGSLDPTFASGGKGTYAISNDKNHARAVAVQADGGIVIAGYANSQGQNDFLGGIRLLPNGVKDTSFGVSGLMVTPFGSGPARAYGMVLQDDGGIVLAGDSYNGSNTDFALVRYVGVLTPEIVVEDQAGASLVDGNTAVDFGSTAGSRVFTVRNTGTAVLSGVHATVDGTNSTDFTIAQPVTTALVPGASIPFTVTFTPGAGGPRLANLHVVSNDASENPFDIGLAGGTAGSPLLVWRLTHFGSADNTGSGADTNDFDHDGLANLLEYAFGGDPRVPAPSIQPTMPPLGGGQRAIAFRCDASRTDITYTVQASATLAAGSWTDIARSTGGAAVQALNGLSTVSDSGVGLRLVTVTPAAGVFPAGRGFLRVKVAE